MNPNKKVDQFNIAPMMTKQITRTKEIQEHTHKTTLNMGKWIPIYADSDVLPNHTKQIDIDYVIRATTFKTPVMDDLFIDFIAFFIPNRLIFDKWAELLGENKDSAWTQETEYTVPQLNFANTATGITEGSLADYFGMARGYKGKVSSLKFKAYMLAWTEWCRNQNVRAPEYPDTSEADIDVNTPTGAKYNQPLEAFKLADYYTTALPEPQKGDAILLPIGDSAPVTGTISGTVIQPVTVAGGQTTDQTVYLKNGNYLKAGNQQMTLNVDGTMTGTTNLSEAISATVSAQRLAFQIQGLLEMDARGGTRYPEIVKNQFSINMPNAMWRPEYLGGGRRPINVNQVVQQSESGTTPLGTTAGFSHNSGRVSIPIKTFCEHGIYMILTTIRQRHSYQKSIDKQDMRKRRYDFATPALMHLGEQPIYQYEIFATGVEANDMKVFGYGEAWTPGYRWKRNIISGAMNSYSSAPLDIWHFGDKYQDAPVLSTEFCKETPTFVDRTLQIASSTTPQFLLDMAFTDHCVIPLTAYSIPGMIDHF